MICTSIKRKEGNISGPAWNLLIRGPALGGGKDDKALANPAP